MTIKKNLWLVLAHYSVGLAFIIPIFSSLGLLSENVFPGLLRCENIEVIKNDYRFITLYSIDKAFCEQGLQAAIPEMFNVSTKYLLIGSGALTLVLFGSFLVHLLSAKVKKEKETYGIIGILLYITLMATLISYLLMKLSQVVLV
ncbi:MAG: hypothetical protein QG568_581 [Patescibacteria group bacterium]|nr:hypothetical protein [Patescibacteria group bacterium]